MTCGACQPRQGWWHKASQKCKECGGWPKPTDERMSQHETGSGYYDDPDREMTVGNFVNRRHGRLLRFSGQMLRDMDRVGHARYTEAEWLEQFNDWEKRQ